MDKDFIRDKFADSLEKASGLHATLLGDMEKRYCRNNKGLCSQVFMRPLGFEGYVLLCGNFSDPIIKGRLHLLNQTRHGIVRLKECRLNSRRTSGIK